MRVAGLVLGVLASVMIVAPGCRRQSEAVGTQAEATILAPTYFKAKHGFDGGLFEMIELSQREGFDTVRTIDDLARFASSVGGAIGFTAHPNFEAGTRSAQAVLWYTRLSPVDASWPLYLFDEREARKLPSAAARSEAMAAAEAKISGKMEQAKRLIAAGGQRGVKLVGNPEERKVLALAVLRQGGVFEHTGSFDVGNCGGCRSVVSGGTPLACGLGVQGQEHWTCCGSTNEIGHCDYWKAIKTQDDGKP